MIRFTHRRCRDEVTALDAEAERLTSEATTLTGQVESLTDDLQAAEHALDEVVDACQSLDYGLGDEVDIPEPLRSRLRDAADLPEVLHRLSEAQEENDRLVRERDDQCEALLVAAHEAGTLVRTWALMAQAGHTAVSPTGPGKLLNDIVITSWRGFATSWPCQDAACDASERTLAWHPDHLDQAYLACECGRVWRAGSEAVERSKQRMDAVERSSLYSRAPLRWEHMSRAALEAADRALPTPALTRRELAA
ncbi:hypothetical protein ABZ635_07205 [Nocardiopsis sp. NPDC007018]|uniref:hypothetical protein n=1 Tax=Nocardiopsis sp. NPDC007018 TaxID=3155721 RepID=UPI0034001534